MAGQALHLYLVLEGGAAPLILAFLEPCGRPAPLPPIFSILWRLKESVKSVGLTYTQQSLRSATHMAAVNKVYWTTL